MNYNLTSSTTTHISSLLNERRSVDRHLKKKVGNSFQAHETVQSHFAEIGTTYGLWHAKNLTLFFLQE